MAGPGPEAADVTDTRVRSAPFATWMSAKTSSLSAEEFSQIIVFIDEIYSVPDAMALLGHASAFAPAFDVVAKQAVMYSDHLIIRPPDHPFP